MQPHIVVIGAGPAGLTSAYLLAKEKIAVTVLESDPENVGGIARTVTYKGYCFDIGGHRFFSKSKEVEDLWSEILPDDMLTRPRSSRIFYKSKFFSYPLRAIEVLYKLGIKESALCFLSYLKAKLFPIRHPATFADWVTNHFGQRLFEIFFKTYTEKVWGMDCNAISADWAAQRIKGLSLWSAMINAILPKHRSNKKSIIKTLIDSFRYPRKGPGMLWEACAEKIKHRGGKVLLGCEVTKCHYNEMKHLWEIQYRNAQGNMQTIAATHIISSAPLQSLAEHYLPEISPHVSHAAKQLKYRDFLIVTLILKDKNQFHDNWIYIHDPSVDVARIQNFKSWSPDMVPDPSMCCYGMEYFCFEGDGLWEMDDQALIQKATREIVRIGLAKTSDILDGCVVRQPKAYPVYDEHYKNNVAIVRHALEEMYPSLFVVGRNGMHKYNNQDHAMMTAMLTVQNILRGERQFDVWCVNQDAEYIESGLAGASSLESGLRQVPQRVEPAEELS
ncbi:MAG: NAD(P)/FAD-dependent oxidoreductase [Gammaproteobacteria bacterium]|nr:NAD(P)/FAD-dependent oxidoreductase [Gammaproteobacteria bacterium]